MKIVFRSRANVRASGWLTGTAALAVMAASCGDEPRSPEQEQDPGIGQATSALAGDNCLVGTVPDAMNAIRNVGGVLTRRGASGAASSDFAWLDDHSLSGCHVQGIVNAYTAGIVFDYNQATRNNTFPATLFGNACPEFTTLIPRLARMVRKVGGAATFTDSTGISHPNTVFHPSGMAAIGTYVFVAVDDGLSTGSPIIAVYDWATNPPQRLTGFQLQGVGPIDSVAAAYDATTNTYFLVMNQDSKNRLLLAKSVGSIAAFTWTHTLSPGNLRYPGKRTSNMNYQGMAIVKECTSKKWYLLGLSNNIYPGCAGNFDSCDDSVIDYAYFDRANTVVTAWQTTGKLANPCDDLLGDICPNFAAAGTAFVTLNGKLGAWASEHWTDGNDLDIVSWSQP